MGKNKFINDSIVILVSFVCLIQSCNNTQKSDSKQIYCDLIKQGHFVAFTDTLGSYVDTNLLFNQNNIFIFNYILIAKQKENYPWVNVECYMPEGVPWHELDSIKICYKATQPIAIKLSQTNLLESGESYRYVLPVSNVEQVLVIKVSDFKQPTWAKQTTIPLTLTDIRSIGFVPEVNDYLAVNKGSFRVSKLIVYGFTARKLYVEKINSIVFNSINKDKFYYTVEDTGFFKISIYDTLNNSLINLSQLVVRNGLQELDIKQMLPKGVYIIEISSKKEKIKIKRSISNIPAVYFNNRF